MPPFRPPEELSQALSSETKRILGEQHILDEEMPRHAEVAARARNLARNYSERRSESYMYFNTVHITPWYDDPEQSGDDGSAVSFRLVHHSGDRREDRNPDLTRLQVKVSSPHPTEEGKRLEHTADLVRCNISAYFDRDGARVRGNAVCLADYPLHQTPPALPSDSDNFTSVVETLDLIEQAQKPKDPTAYID